MDTVGGDIAPRVIRTECCVVGGGPAGMMAGLLFARAGVSTIVIEKHGDFLRDFRGDTVHPSTMQIMHELGFLDAFLERPHQKLTHLSGAFGAERVEVVTFERLDDLRCPYIALMPQWEFLDFIAGQARRLTAFSLAMNTEGAGLLTESDRVVGVRATDPNGPVEIRARLTIAADGRRSVLRGLAGLSVADLGAPIDVLWFRVAKDPSILDATLLHAGPGRIVITIDRGDYWQCACVIPKGAAETVRKAGIDSFRASVAKIVPGLAAAIGDLGGWDDVKLLTVTVDRLNRWHRPGLLCIGDAAHAMSPIGGVGINLAIQDAVAAANMLAGPLADGRYADRMLGAVARRRLFPTRVIQFVQIQMQNRLLAPIVADPDRQPRPPLPMRLISGLPVLQRMIARILGMGVRPEHVRSPQVAVNR